MSFASLLDPHYGDLTADILSDFDEQLLNESEDARVDGCGVVF